MGKRALNKEDGAMKRRRNDVTSGIPDEVLTSIIALSPSSIFACLTVCKRWHRAALNPSYWEKQLKCLEWTPSNQQENQRQGESYMRYYLRLSNMIKCRVCGHRATISAFSIRLCFTHQHGSANIGVISQHLVAPDFLLDELDLFSLQDQCYTVTNKRLGTLSFFRTQQLLEISEKKFGSIENFLSVKERRRHSSRPDIPANFTLRRHRTLEIALYRKRGAWASTFVFGIPLLLPEEHLSFSGYAEGRISAAKMAELVICKSEEINRSAFAEAAVRYIREYDESSEPLTSYASLLFKAEARKRVLENVVKKDKRERWSTWEIIELTYELSGDEGDEEEEKDKVREESESEDEGVCLLLEMSRN